MTEIYVPESPPIMQTDDGRVMAEYLGRQFLAISAFLKSTYAGHAGLYLSAPATALTSITPIPQKIVGFDAQQTGETGALSIIANSTIQFLETGIWIVGLQAKFDVASSSANTTREIEVQFYDETNTTALDVIASGSIARYGAVCTINGVIMAEVRENITEHEFALYVYSPSGDTITITQTDVLDFFLFRASNYLHTGT